MLKYINDLGGDKLDPRYAVEDGVLNAGCDIGCVPFMEASVAKYGFILVSISASDTGSFLTGQGGNHAHSASPEDL